MTTAKPPALDHHDLEILSILQEDARTSNAEIGRRLGLVPSAILQRIRKLRDQGVIEGHESRVSPAAVGLGLAAFLFVRADEALGSRHTIERLAAMGEVLEVHHVAGEDCYLLKVRAADAAALGKFLRETLGAIKSIRSTRTTIVLETLKETSRLPLGGPATDA